MPNGSSGSTNATSSIKTDPWSGEQPYLGGNATTPGIFPQAAAIYGAGAPGYFPGSTVAPMSPETQSSLAAQMARATNGSPLVDAAQTQSQHEIGGAYLGANPTLNAVDQSMWAQIAPNIASQFSGAGRYGSGAMASADTTAFSNAMAPYHFTDYENERARQDAATAGAPALAQTDYTDIAAGRDVGSAEQTQAQAQIDASKAAYDYTANAPMDWLRQYAGLITGSTPASAGTQTSKQAIPTTPWYQSLLGAIPAAAGIGRAAFGA